MTKSEGQFALASSTPKSGGHVPLSPIVYSTAIIIIIIIIIITRMWANAQRDGSPAEYRWRPLFNAAKFG